MVRNTKLFNGWTSRSLGMLLNTLIEHTPGQLDFVIFSLCYTMYPYCAVFMSRSVLSTKFVSTFLQMLSLTHTDSTQVC